MNKRDQILQLVHGTTPSGQVPAAFFQHFGPDYLAGPAAVERHLAFFRQTGMDFVKIQYEQKPPPGAVLDRPADWARLPRCTAAYFEPTLSTVAGLVAAARSEALVILTVYSPFMWAKHTAGAERLAQHLREDPAAVSRGLEILTENVLTLVRAGRQAGLDGFYISTQGGEATRFPGTDLFERYIKPTDLAVWSAAQGCEFNILHICDYDAGYDDLAQFLDYPGHVVNLSLEVGGRTLTPGEASRLFGRPFMGGLERKGVLATGTPAAIRQTVEAVVARAPERFLLAADCTVPADTPWVNLKAAIDAAHDHRRR